MGFTIHFKSCSLNRKIQSNEWPPAHAVPLIESQMQNWYANIVFVACVKGLNDGHSLLIDLIEQMEYH